MTATRQRCAWIPADNSLYTRYHDEQWGVPVHDDTLLFEMLLLEGAQAGLSWLTILKKRENYRRAFDQFDAQRVARYDQAKLDELAQDSGIIRNKLKINWAVKNAQAFLAVQADVGSFDRYIWQFVDGRPLINHWQRVDQIPAKTEISDRMSRELKKRGFGFVGSTICYAFMQSIGMVNDHTVDCFRHAELLP